MGSNPGAARRQPAHTSAVRTTFGTLDDLMRAAEDVRGLLAHPGWAHVVALLDAEVTDLDIALDGRLLEHTEYAFKHGQRRSLHAAPDLAHAIVSVWEDEYAKQQAKHESGAGSPLREAS